MNLSRISRLVQLLGLLQDKGLNADELAAACKVSRTIFRDLDVLRKAGVPVLFDDDRGVYHIPGIYFLPPTNFTTEEALVVTALCQELGNRRLPFYESALSAGMKLASILPARIRDYVREATAGVRIHLTPTSRPHDVQTPSDQRLQASIAACRAVQIVYDDFTNRHEVKLTLSPYQLLFTRLVGM